MFGIRKRWGVYLHYDSGRVELGTEHWTQKGAQDFINWLVMNTSWNAPGNGSPSLSVARIP